MYTPSSTSPRTVAPARPSRSVLLAGVGLATAVLFGLVACGDDDADTAATTSPPVTMAAIEPTTITEPTATPTTDAPTTDAPTTEAPVEETTIDVVAADYSFTGLPTTLDAGSYTMSFANEGTEQHEIALFKNPEGLTMEELAALGPEEGPKHVEVAAILMAGPGSAAAEAATLELTPGEYIATCFIPTADGVPHFAHGMSQTLTVG
jgi:hypothetical protein